MLSFIIIIINIIFTIIKINLNVFIYIIKSWDISNDFCNCEYEIKNLSYQPVYVIETFNCV